MFHMTNAGVENVWLADGYKTGQDKFGPYYNIDDVPGLYRAIAITLVRGGAVMANRELKLIRRQLDLTQAELGARLGRTEQTVLLWERNGKIPADAARQIKLMVLERLAPDTPIAEAFRAIERARPEKFVFTRRGGTWRAAGDERATVVSDATFSAEVIGRAFIQHMYASTLDKETSLPRLLVVWNKADVVRELRAADSAPKTNPWAGAYPSRHGVAPRKETVN